MANPKRPKDTNERAKYIVDLLTGQAQEPDPNEGKNPAAVELGRLGGLKGGKARAKSLSEEERIAIAKKAANANSSAVSTINCMNSCAFAAPTILRMLTSFARSMLRAVDRLT